MNFSASFWDKSFPREGHTLPRPHHYIPVQLSNLLPGVMLMCPLSRICLEPCVEILFFFLLCFFYLNIYVAIGLDLGMSGVFSALNKHGCIINISTDDLNLRERVRKRTVSHALHQDSQAAASDCRASISLQTTKRYYRSGSLGKLYLI